MESELVVEPPSEDDMDPAGDWKHASVLCVAGEIADWPGAGSGLATGGAGTDGKVIGGGRNEIMKVKNGSSSIVSNWVCISASLNLWTVGISSFRGWGSRVWIRTVHNLVHPPEWARAR